MLSQCLHDSIIEGMYSTTYYAPRNQDNLSRTVGICDAVYRQYRFQRNDVDINLLSLLFCIVE